MTRKAYIALWLLLPLVAAALFFVVRHNLATGPSAPDPAAAVAPAAPDETAPAVPEKKPEVVRPAGISDYRDLQLTLPRAAADLLRKSRPGIECAGILVAPERELVLWSKDADELVPIASMTKMMTTLVAFELIAARDDLSLDTVVAVSRAAQNIGGSEIWLMAGHRYPLRDLLRASVVKSANDAMYAVAERTAPGNDVQQFVVVMNRRARQLGMSKARFRNVHGLPEPDRRDDNRASCRDLVVLALALRRYPEIWEWCKLDMVRFRHNNGKVVDMYNSNRRLLRHCSGVTGLKTGYTKTSGFCVTATCRRGGEQLIAVVTGFKNKNDRYLFVSRLFEWGYARLPYLSAPNGSVAAPEME